MKWFKCSKEAYEKCSDHATCDPFGQADYGEGSDCDKFNQRIARECAMERGLDLVDVVRCKNCIHRLEGTKMCQHPKAMGWDAIEPEDDDFCSYGERREGE